ncbi:MAG: carboxypeptidase-like regulatory domain-containing protein [Breznakibacter sp.]
MASIRKWSVIVFFIIGSVVQGSAQDALLKKQLSLKFTSITIRGLLDTLAVRLGAGLSYDADALPLDSVVSVNWADVELKTSLYGVLGRENVEISSLPGQIVISRHCAAVPRPFTKPVRITGKVVDAEDGQPLPSVSIGVENAPIGTMTNAEGEFEFLVPRDLGDRIGESSIFFSMIGYAREKVSIPLSDTTLVVPMDPTHVRLPEVQVMPVSADLLIAKVVEMRDRNYLQSSVALTGFFRESVKQDDRFVQVSEAVIEVYKPPYAESFNMERVRFVKGRKNEDVEQMDLIQFRLQGGPFYFSRLDIMRYLDFFPDKQSVPVYKYIYLNAEWVDNRTFFRIAFMPINDNGDLLYNGEFLIDAQTYAVVSVWFEMTKQTLKESRKYLIKKDSRDFKAKPYFAKYIVTYRPFKDRWILNSVRGDIKIKVGDRKNKVDADFEATTEMLISDLRPIDGERLRYAESFRPDYVLAEQLTGADPDFWKDFNVIKPDEELERVFKKPLGE